MTMTGTSSIAYQKWLYGKLLVLPESAASIWFFQKVVLLPFSWVGWGGIRNKN